MLHVCRRELGSLKVVLASASPRRRELLQQLGLTFQVQPSTFDELLDKAAYATGADYAADTAKHKAKQVAEDIASDGAAADIGVLVVGSDTVVDLDGEILENPNDREHAIAMLRKLSGRSHRVHTGVALYIVPRGIQNEGDGGLKHRLFAETTEVTFSALDDETIAAYVDSGEPMDKAGSYGIQQLGGSFVPEIKGCYFNVMGLPLNRLSRELAVFLSDDAKV